MSFQLIFLNKHGVIFLDGSNVKCYVGVCYRRPTIGIYNSLNHSLLQNIIRELGCTKKHFLLMGDSNYRFLSWPPYDDDDDDDISKEAGEFCECRYRKWCYFQVVT